MADDTPKPGVTARAREHWARVAEAAHGAIAGKIDDHANARLAETLERFERELVPHVGPFIADAVANENLDPAVRDLLRAISEPEHFTQSLLVGIAVGAIISPVLGAITAPTGQDIANEVWSHNPVVPLSPAQAAEALLRHNPNVADPYGEALKSGVNRKNLDALTYNAGNALPPEELLLLFRRGQITKDRLTQGVRENNLRDEWLPELLDLRYSPPGAGEVVAGLLKQHLTTAQAETYLANAGTDPANLPWLLATAGRPYGTMQALELLNRGEIDEARVRQVIAQSDVNPAYTDDILKLRTYFPPPRSIVPMLRSGAITEAYARELFAAHGLRPADVEAFIKEAHHTTTSEAKTLTATQVARAYEQRLIDKPAAQARLATAKYSPADAELYLDLADQARVDSFRAVHVSLVHEQFKHHKLEIAAATAALSRLNIPADAITDMVKLWTDERDAKIVAASLSQLQGGLRRGLLTLPEFVKRVQALGYAGIDVKLVAAESFPPTDWGFAQADKPPATIPAGAGPHTFMPERIFALDPTKL